MVSIFLKIGKGTLSLIDPHRHMSVGGAANGHPPGAGSPTQGQLDGKCCAACSQPLTHGAATYREAAYGQPAQGNQSKADPTQGQEQP